MHAFRQPTGCKWLLGFLNPQVAASLGKLCAGNGMRNRNLLTIFPSSAGFGQLLP